MSRARWLGGLVLLECAAARSADLTVELIEAPERFAAELGELVRSVARHD